MGIKQQVFKGVGWNSIATFTNMGLNFLKIVFLTRILDKSDFGIVAIAMMVIGLMSIFSDLGLTIAIIHKQDTSDEQYSSLFWANLIFNFFLYFILFCLSPLIASFYKEAILLYVILILGLEIIANSFGKIFQTIKMKEMDFRFISIVTIISSVSGFVLTVILALLKFGVYSLAIGQIFGVIVTQFIFAISGIRRTHISFHLNLKEITSYLSIGAFHLGARVIDYVASKIDVLLIGNLWGLDSLGTYNLAKELLQKPFIIIFSVIGNVFTSAFALIQNDLEKMRTSFCKLAQLLSVLFMPVCFTFFIFAQPLVTIFYGEDFVDVAPILRALVIFELINNIERTVNPVRTALGRTDLSLLWAVVLFIITIAVVCLAKDYSIVTLAWCLSGINLLALLFYWYFNVKILINLKFVDFLSPFCHSFILSVLSGFLSVLILQINQSFEIVFVSFFTFVLLYFGLLLLNHKGNLKSLFYKIK